MHSRRHIVNRILKVFAFIVIITFMTVVPGPDQANQANGEAVYIVPSAGSSSGNVLKYQSVVNSTNTVNKPTCSSGSPYIFVFPVYAIGSDTTNIYAITGISTYAVDNGSYWTVRAQVKDVRNQLYEGAASIKAIVQVWCCSNATCS